MGKAESTAKFGEMVREARQKLGISLRQLGEQIRKSDGSHLSPQYLNDVEHGRRNPPDEEIIKQMAKALELDANVLLAVAGKGPKELKEYLEQNPEASEPIGRLFRKAREKGFRDWERLEREIEQQDAFDFEAEKKS